MNARIYRCACAFAMGVRPGLLREVGASMLVIGCPFVGGFASLA
jgi:hypothetical protein